MKLLAFCTLTLLLLCLDNIIVKGLPVQLYNCILHSQIWAGVKCHCIVFLQSKTLFPERAFLHSGPMDMCSTVKSTITIYQL